MKTTNNQKAEPAERKETKNPTTLPAKETKESNVLSRLYTEAENINQARREEKLRKERERILREKARYGMD